MFSLGDWIQKTIEMILLSVSTGRLYCPPASLQTPHSSFLVSAIGLFVIQTHRIPAEGTPILKLAKTFGTRSQSTVYDEMSDSWNMCYLYYLWWTFLIGPDQGVGPHLGVHYLIPNCGLALLTLIERSWTCVVGRPYGHGPLPRSVQ